MFPETCFRLATRLCCLLTAAAGIVAPATSQALTLQGTIRGPDQAPVAGAVTARNVDRGIAWTLMSAADGRFRLENLPAGRYALSFRGKALPTHTLPTRALVEDEHVEISMPQGVPAEPLTSAEMLVGLPESGDARQLLRFHCVQCHGLELIVGAARTSQEWDATVQKMAARVPPAPDGQMQRISDYLAGQFAPDGNSRVSLIGQRAFEFHSSAVMVELDLPKSGAHPHDIRQGPDGDIWVADFDVRPNLASNDLFRVNPETLEITRLKFEVDGAGARSVEFDASGTAWVSVLFGNMLAKLNPGGEAEETYAIPGDVFWPHSVAVSNESEIWITGMMSDELARFDPRTETFERIDVPTPRSMLYDIEIDSAGVIWYTGLFSHHLGRYDPATGTFAEFPTPTELSSTRYMYIAPDGHIWVSLFAAGKLARFDPDEESFREFELPDPNSSPYDLWVGGPNEVWYTDFTRNSLGRFDPESGSLLEFAIPSSPYALPTELERDDSGRIWFCENGTGKIGFVAERGNPEPGVYRVPDAQALR